MKNKKIMIVDDEAQLVDLIKLRLEKEEYQVAVAYDGEEALHKIRQEKPDLIILDLMLPKMDGYMICSLFKRDKRFSHVPIILFTARSQAEDIQLGEKVGADAYITKPYEPQILLDKIKELLEK
jgi:two-component system, OmpR family, alkaline phosphatase synthesis response regulator PhoP